MAKTKTGTGNEALRQALLALAASCDALVADMTKQLQGPAPAPRLRLLPGRRRAGRAS